MDAIILYVWHQMEMQLLPCDITSSTNCALICYSPVGLKLFLRKSVHDRSFESFRDITMYAISRLHKSSGQQHPNNFHDATRALSQFYPPSLMKSAFEYKSPSSTASTPNSSIARVGSNIFTLFNASAQDGNQSKTDPLNISHDILIMGALSRLHTSSAQPRQKKIHDVTRACRNFTNQV